jgi:CRP-like cAMP-binding protein
MNRAMNDDSLLDERANSQPPLGEMRKRVATPRASSIRQFLKSTTFLGGLADAALDALLRRGKVQKFSPGAPLCRRDEPGDTVMVIMKGAVKIANSNVEGKEIVLNFLGPGDTSGEIAVLTSIGRTADAIALENTEVFVLHARDLLPALAAHPQALLEIGQLLCDKLRDASVIIEDNSLDMRRRVARGLLRLARQHGRNSNEGIRVGLTASQSELGAYVGLSRENVSRLLRRLRDEGVIRSGRGQLIITDERALACIAGAGCERPCAPGALG